MLRESLERDAVRPRAVDDVDFHEPVHLAPVAEYERRAAHRPPVLGERPARDLLAVLEPSHRGGHRQAVYIRVRISGI
jgi:hypothetical protein